jgi:phospholipase C
VIDTVVVLALENRSFDHLLGWFDAGGRPFAGLRSEAGAGNWSEPPTQSGTFVPAGDDAPYVPDLDPGGHHELAHAQFQLFGRAAWPPDPLAPPHNTGFLADYATLTGGDLHAAAHVMRCFAPAKVPVLTALAHEFAVCDHWFSSVPGPTWPNRFFIHSATSDGATDNTPRVYDQRTIYQNLAAAGHSWRVYYHDFPQSLALAQQIPACAENYEYFEAFLAAAAAGRLPRYSFIEPRYFNELWARANDQHPPHGIVGGENLIADVYEALRASPQWNSAALIVLHDEHGGFYDHVPPPATVSPDGKTSGGFDFTRLGVRVPAVVASPYVERGTIDQTVYDHSSIAATLRDLFGLGASLTRRDAQAATLLPLLGSRATPRTDAPAKLPRPRETVLEAAVAGRSDATLLSHMQIGLLGLARGIAHAADLPLGGLVARTEHDCSLLAKQALGALGIRAKPST